MLPCDSLLFDVQRAVRMSWILREVDSPETTIYVYNKQGFSWMPPGGRGEYKFVIDSIDGRGDKRRALLGRSFRIADSTNWVWYRRKADGVGFDTLGRRSDSTVKISEWLSYSRRVFDDKLGAWYLTNDPVGSLRIFMENWNDRDFNYKLTIRMEKVLGDPTKNKGIDQIPVLKAAFIQLPSDSLNDVWDPFALAIPFRSIMGPVLVETDSSGGVKWFSSTKADSGYVEFTLKCWVPGKYYGWATVIAPDASRDSWYFGWNGTEDIFDADGVYGPNPKTIKLQGRGGLAQPFGQKVWAPFDFPTGLQTVVFRGREPGCKITTVVFSRDSSFVK